ncbi:hypothetical protein EB796_006888 [Bugula neritina]|uniref:Uncharacterized protein n=1 Tax=Bugula neritina TaxID=10212 RepID=A0A7J7K848_BUGNE|nr:hypothetical protein EB796_006888 [Bugula neritina]
MKLQGPQSNYCMEPRLPATPLQPLATQLSYEGQQQVLKHRLHSDGGDNHNIYEEMRDVGKSHSFRKTTKDLTNRPLPNTGYAGSERKQFDEVEEGTDYSAYSVPPGPGIKKYNPLYGEISSTEKRESLDKKLRESHMSSSPSVVNIKRDNSCNKCSCGISLLAILVSLAAMAIVLLTATNTISLASDLSSTGAIGVSSAITSQSEFDKLAQNQVEGSSSNTDSTFSGINSSLLLFESQLTDVTSNISHVHQSLFDFITNVSNSVPSQGPKGEQGPQGATGFINVSLCSHRRNLRILSSRTALTQVVLDSSQEKIIAATCSFKKYTAATLKTSTQNSFNTYQCSCTTIESTAPSDGECAIDYWACALPASV